MNKPARLCTYIISASQTIVYSEGVDYSLLRAMVRLDALYKQGRYSEQRTFLKQIGVQCGQPIAAEGAPEYLQQHCDRLYRMLQEVQWEIDEEIMAQRPPITIARPTSIEDIEF